MCKFWLAFLLVILCASRVHAVELMIYDPIVSDLSITFTASLSASSNYYFQGVLRSQSSSKYFGETQNSKGDWIDYISSPEKENIASNFFLTDVKNATWSGILKLRFKTDDSNYQGPGIYDLKLRRFTGGSSSSAGESNTLIVNLTAIIPTPTPLPSPIPSPSPIATATPAHSLVAILAQASGQSFTPLPLASPATGTVAGETTQIDLSGFGVPPAPVGESHDSSAKPVINKSRARTTILIGAGLLILSLTSFFGYRRYQKHHIITQ